MPIASIASAGVRRLYSSRAQLGVMAAWQTFEGVRLVRKPLVLSAKGTWAFSFARHVPWLGSD